MPKDIQAKIKEEIKEFSRLIKKYSYKEDLYVGRGLLHTKIKLYKKATEDYTKTYTNYMNYDILSVCERNNLINEAEEIYTKAINANKNNFENYTRRSVFYMHVGQTKKALADCETALRLSPNNKIILILKETLIKKLKK